jgi:tetratricopeptide (TPR) repeat protein
VLHSLERNGMLRRERRSAVTGEDEYAFRHVLVRDVAYGQIPRIERARKHRRAAEWIEQLTAERGEDHAQRAAHHWLAALELTRAAHQEDPELAARACAALVDGADRAYRLGASDGARELYGQALELSPADDADRPTLLLLYGRAAARSGVDADAELIEATERFLAAGDVERAADAMLARTWFLWNAGDDLSSSRLLDQALELVADRPPSALQALLYGEYAIRSMLKGRRAEALGYAERELEIGLQIGDERFRADALITVGTARGIAGEEAGLGDIERGLELALELNDVPVIVRGYKNLQSLAAYFDVDRAAALAEDGRRAAIRYGDGFHVGWFQVEQGLYMFLGGAWDEAIGRLKAFLGELGERKHYMVGPAYELLGRIHAERGEPAAAIPESALGLEFARSVQDHQVLLPALASHACVLLRGGQPVEAGHLLDEYLLLVDQTNCSLADAALALTLLGREHEFGALPPFVRQSPWGAAGEAFTQGDFANAAALYQGMGARLYEAESRLRLARQLAAGGRQADAKREAAAAAAFFERAGAEPRLAESQAAMRASA